MDRRNGGESRAYRMKVQVYNPLVWWEFYSTDEKGTLISLRMGKWNPEVGGLRGSMSSTVCIQGKNACKE